MKNKISVIIPVYNVEKYLERCLKSVITQSLKDIEIIVVNDCSPDNSLEIIRKYMKIDRRIILINKDINEGVSSARNSGLNIAQGEYILYIDSDDWIEQNYLKDMYEIAIKYRADMVITDYYYDYDNEKIFYQTDQYGNTGEILNNKKVLENLAFGKEKSGCQIWNRLIKKDVYIKNNIKFLEKISMGEDLYAVSFLIYYSKIIVKLDKAYIHYIQNPNSLTKNIKYSRLNDIYCVLNQLEKFFKNKNLNIFIKELKLIHLSNLIFQLKPNFKDELYSKILDEYLLLLEEKKGNKNNEKYIKYYFLLSKVFNSKLSFKIIWNLIKIKKNARILLGK